MAHCCWPGCDTHLKPGHFFGPICTLHAFEVIDKAETYQSIEWDRTRTDAIRRQTQANAERADRTKARGDAPGWVYYALIDGQIKIGYAVDVKKRMRAYPPTTELLAVHPGTPALEQAMHREFADLLLRGREWFSDCPKLRDHIARVLESFPNPERHAYRFTEARHAP